MKKIAVGALVTALVAGVAAATYTWYQKQNQQQEECLDKALKEDSINGYQN